MKMNDKFGSIISKIEILIAIIMFFVMLFSCGLYINIKLNGKISNLPPLSANDTKMLLRSSNTDDVELGDDLLEPVFIGVCNDSKMMAALPTDSVRCSAVGMLKDSVAVLFGGEFKKIEFDSNDILEKYVDDLKKSDDFILFKFFGDLPSTVVMPCMLDNFELNSSGNDFLFKYLFLLSDDDGNLYACAISDDGLVTEIHPEQKVKYDKILNESYDISDGWTEFEFSANCLVDPLLLSSFVMSDYRIDSLSTIYGKESNQSWVQNLFDVFSLNANLIRSFTSGDKTEINHVEDFGELIINDDGDVVYKASDDGGVSLDEYADRISDSVYSSSFADKIFGLKTIINKLYYKSSEISHSMIGIDFDDALGSLKVYFKYMTDGVFLYESPYDAVFEISNNKLVYAHFKAVKCEEVVDMQTVVIPEKYAFVSGADTVYKDAYLVLTDDSGDTIRSVNWSIQKSLSEVN